MWAWLLSHCCTPFLDSWVIWNMVLFPTKVLLSICHRLICKFSLFRWCDTSQTIQHYRVNLFLMFCSTTKVVQGVFTVATFISYGLQCYVPVDIIWGNYLSKRLGDKIYWEFAVRIGIVLMTCKQINLNEFSTLPNNSNLIYVSYIFCFFFHYVNEKSFWRSRSHV